MRPDIAIGEADLVADGLFAAVDPTLADRMLDALGVGGLRDGVEVTVANAVRTPRDPLTGSGTGLIGLAERVRIIGGRLEHGLDGERFRLSAWLPWPP